MVCCRVEVASGLRGIAVRYVVTAVLAMSLVFVASPSSGQEWSDTQKEVWQNVEKYSDLYVKEDLEGMMAYFHDDFLGWERTQWYPTNKADRRVIMERDFATSDVLFEALKPAGIKVHGNVAIVHYYITLTVKDLKGEETTLSGHWTDILMKQGSKWVMIGDAGGAVPEDD